MIFEWTIWVTKKVIKGKKVVRSICNWDCIINAFSSLVIKESGSLFLFLCFIDTHVFIPLQAFLISLTFSLKEFLKCFSLAPLKSKRFSIVFVIAVMRLFQDCVFILIIFCADVVFLFHKILKNFCNPCLVRNFSSFLFNFSVVHEYLIDYQFLPDIHLSWYHLHHCINIIPNLFV